MTAPTHPISPLRQRMIDDMRMRQLSPKTQHHYLRAVRQFAGFLGRSPDMATAEDLRRYQLHLVDGGTSPVSLNADPSLWVAGQCRAPEEPCAGACVAAV
jgi:integrase/recombinase XerD